MASQTRAVSGSGKAPLLTPSPVPGLLIDKIVFIPDGGNDGGNIAPPPGFGDGGSTTPTPAPVGNTPTVVPQQSPPLSAPPPPLPTPIPTPVVQSPPSPTPEPVINTVPDDPSQNALPSSTSPQISEFMPPVPQKSAFPSNPTDTSSEEAQLSFPVTSVPLPTEFTEILPLSAAQRTAIIVSSCTGLGSCTTVSGKIFSFLPTSIASASSDSWPGGSVSLSFSIFNPSSIFDPSGPTFVPQDLGRDGIKNPFDKQSLAIILISTTCYFIISTTSIVGAFLILRRRRRRGPRISIEINKESIYTKAAESITGQRDVGLHESRSSSPSPDTLGQFRSWKIQETETAMAMDESTNPGTHPFVFRDPEDAARHQLSAQLFHS